MSPSFLAVGMRLVGAKPLTESLGLEILPGKVNYLRGDKPSGWKTEIPTLAQVVQKGVYHGVDVIYRGTPQVSGR